MDKTLGLDLGTNSIGWAIVTSDENEPSKQLRNRGTCIFQEGVKYEKGVESSKAADRTAHRSSRRHYFRLRLRKIEVLKVLVEYDLCPTLTAEQLAAWKQRRQYPLSDEFLAWQRTDGHANKNPYRYRWLALSGALDLGKRADRHILGRALYHLAQRRGFLSNRLDSAEDRDGQVVRGIGELNDRMKAAGCTYLGEYFYRLYESGEKIRGAYTSREQHYRAEFDAVCRRQSLPGDLVEALERAVFFQRPLRSKKGLVGKCTFEKGKSCCPLSHPRFEEFRMRQFINQIKIKTPADPDFRPLDRSEAETVVPLFLRKSKKRFSFEDIAKLLSKKAGYRNWETSPVEFNYRNDTSVPGCPVTTRLVALFGPDWQDELCRRYTPAAGKTSAQIADDVWHAMFSFDDGGKLKVWASDKLRLDAKQAEEFAKPLPSDYASLSLNAIDKILPYLRAGLRYDEAVFLANLPRTVPAEKWNDPVYRQAVTEGVMSVLDDFTQNPTNGSRTKQKCVQDFLLDNYDISYDRSRKLYHPSITETYADAQPGPGGLLLLGSPRTPAVRNPMAMRTLFRLRALVNALLRDGQIDRQTKINIELARDLNDANMRKAIAQEQRDNEKKRQEARKNIIELYKEETGRTIEPTEDDLLKYRLWEEQNHICLYTDEHIGLSRFIGPNPDYDIDHTIPRSAGGDDSQMNKTLCEKEFNRKFKGVKLPSELPDHRKILARVDGWRQKYEELTSQIERTKGTFPTKEIRDTMIQRRHRLRMQRDYWRGKYRLFTMTEAPKEFRKNQDTDNKIIGRFARFYLQTVFPRVYTVKSATTADLRKMWGLQEYHTRKERGNHTNHCLDAIVVASIGRKEYGELANYYHNLDRHDFYGDRPKPHFPKPWPTFTEDVKAIENELLISHHTADNLPKHTRKKLRARGRIRRDEQGNPILCEGDTARGSLHQDTFYGAIMRQGELKYVVRKSLGQLQESDVDKIVDEAVRAKVRQAVDEKGFRQAMAGDVWMNEERRIPIRKVRLLCNHVASPIHLKAHRDRSRHEYKRDYHVVNDGNHCMAVYEGTDERDRVRRSFRLVNNIEAARFFKRSRAKTSGESLIPSPDPHGYPLRYLLKTGEMVLFYENDPKELLDGAAAELSKRLYKLVGMSSMTVREKYEYGVLTFKHHQEARPTGELTIKKGEYKQGEPYRPMIGMHHTQLRMLVESSDFEMTVTGEIRFKR